MYNKKYLLMALVLLVAILPFVCADTLYLSELGLPIPQGECFNIPLSCDNCTYMNITIAYPNGTIAVTNQAMDSISPYSYNYTFCDTNTLGNYMLITNYDDDGVYLSSETNFLQVTPNGESATEGKAVFYIGLLLVLVIFLVGAVVIFMESENLLARVGMIGLGYLLLITITFLAWNMSADFLTSSPFMIAMFRILFFLLIIGAFPLVIGGFVWYFIMLFKVKEIEKLMTKGFSLGEAERRIKGRKR